MRCKYDNDDENARVNHIYHTFASNTRQDVGHYALQPYACEFPQSADTAAFLDLNAKLPFPLAAAAEPSRNPPEQAP